MLGVRRWHEHPADALTGKRQALRVAVTDDGALVDGGHPGNLGTVGDLAIRLVGDEVDGMIRLLAATLERGSKLLEGLARIDGAHGVVGRVDDNGGGALGDGGGLVTAWSVMVSEAAAPQVM